MLLGYNSRWWFLPKRIAKRNICHNLARFIHEAIFLDHLETLSLVTAGRLGSKRRLDWGYEGYVSRIPKREFA
eukprot:scaffold2157_cov376-Prasinococcus_capsulatus_cf.AAC.12